MRYLHPKSFCWLCVGLLFGVAAEARAADEVAMALHAALAKNISHAKDKADEKDMKSLAQTAGGLQILAEMLKARSDDKAWQEANGKLLAAAADLQAAARAGDATKCAGALVALEKVAAATAGVSPTGKPQELPKSPGIRPLMPVLDGAYADAKIALLTGNLENAKKQALVLSELGQLVSNSRTGEPWAKMAGHFRQACLAAATTTETNPQTVRQLFRGISQQCEACHKTR